MPEATAEQFKPQLPKAIRNQARKAERAFNEAYRREAAPAEGDDALPVPPATAASAEVVNMAVQQPAEPKKDEPAAPPQAAQPAPAPAEPPKEDWEQKYRTLQGMIERESREKKALQQQIEGMQATIAAINRAQDAAQTELKSAPVPGTRERRLRQEDIDAYGEDMIKVIRAAAHDEFQPLIDKLRTENEELKKQLHGVVETNARSEAQTTEQLLTQEVPNWREINESPEFLDWLAQPDPFSGVTRHDLLRQAGASPRVVQFFKAYLNESQAIRGHQEAQQQAPEPVQARQAGPIVDKTSLVAPGRPSSSQGTGAGGAVDSEDPQFFTQKQISAFYREVQQGKWKNRPKEKDKLERAIHKAAMEGRVRA